MKVLTVKHPWAWLICAGLKDIENRPRKSSHRGPLLIQSSAKMIAPAEWDEALRFCAARAVELPPRDTLLYGGIVGMVEVTGCVAQSKSPWFVGPWGYTLARGRGLPFIPLRGQLSIFDAPLTVLERLTLPVDSAPLLFPYGNQRIRRRRTGDRRNRNYCSPIVR